MSDDPQQVWARPPASPGAAQPPGSPGPAQPQLAQGNWWYQYPNGSWIWWSPQQNAWVPVQVTRSAPTPWWVWVLILLAVGAVVVGAIAFFSDLAEEIGRVIEEERLRNEINVLRG